MTRYERRALETRNHDSLMIKYFGVVLVMGACLAVLFISFNF